VSKGSAPQKSGTSRTFEGRLSLKSAAVEALSDKEKDPLIGSLKGRPRTGGNWTNKKGHCIKNSLSGIGSAAILTEEGFIGGSEKKKKAAWLGKVRWGKTTKTNRTKKKTTKKKKKGLMKRDPGVIKAPKKPPGNYP